MNAILVIDEEDGIFSGALMQCVADFAGTGDARITIACRRPMAKRAIHAPVQYTPNGFTKETVDDVSASLDQHIRSIIQLQCGFQPEVNEIDISAMDTSLFTHYINDNKIDLVIKGSSSTDPTPSVNGINWQAVLNKITVPILLIPKSWKYTPTNHISYLTDLRYCRTDILRYMRKLTSSFTDVKVSLAHMCFAGLPDLSADFAVSIFEEIAKKWVDDNLILHHIREKEILRVVDVLINGMENNMLILINHTSNFQKLLKPSLQIRYPHTTGVPLLLFPN